MGPQADKLICQVSTFRPFFARCFAVADPISPAPTTATSYMALSTDPLPNTRRTQRHEIKEAAEIFRRKNKQKLNI